MTSAVDTRLLSTSWTHEERQEGIHRWLLSVGDFEGGARVVVGDSDGSGLHSIWGYNAIGPTIWSFDGSGVHLPGYARILGAALLQVLCRRHVVTTMDWEPDDAYGQFSSVHRTSFGDFRLMVRARPMLISNGRRISHPYDGYETAAHEEIVPCWGWWLDLPRSGGGLHWRMHSWCAMRDERATKSYVERIAQAFTDEGFGIQSVLEAWEAVQ